MTRTTVLAGMATLVAGMSAGALLARQPPQGPQPFYVGNRLGLPVNPAADGGLNAMSSNVKVYGAIYSAESCAYDAARGVIVVPNRGVAQNVQTNNAWVSFVNHDGSVHTARWLGIQAPAERAALTPALVLNEPYGSNIANGILTFSREAQLLKTEHAAQTGSDGIVIMPDGTKYVSSVQNGGVSRLRPGRPAELIAQNIPSAASMCYDAGAKQLVIPMNANNGLAFVPLN
jgi:hypothetical protein